MEEAIINEIVESALPYSDVKGKDNKLNLLANCVLKTPKSENQPPFLEIGTRGGGSALVILKIIEKFYPGSVLITVDPYGEKPYDNKRWSYGDKFYLTMKKVLASYKNHIHYHMTSEEFVNIMDQISFWYKGGENDFSKLSFIFLDGSHLPATVKFEFNNLFLRLIKNGYMVIDNTDFYDGEMRKYFEKKRNKDIEVKSTDHQTVVQKLN
jgi:hypothetical protein